jgi:hypothetical protein
VVEKGREVAPQRCDRELLHGTELTLSVAAEVGMQNLQGSGRQTSTLRSEQAAGF